MFVSVNTVQRLFHVERMTVGKMSLTFAGIAQVGARPDKATIQKMLDENGQLIKVIVRYQSMGRFVQYFFAYLLNQLLK